MDSGERLREVFRAKARGDSPYLIEALNDPDVRDAAARALGGLGDRSAIPPLIRLLDARDPHVRAAAANALGRLDAHEAIGPLEELARGAPEPWVVEWAMLSLSSLSGRDATGTLVDLLRDPRRRVRRAAAVFLGRMGDPAVLEDIVRARRDERWFRRRPFREAERQLRRDEGNA